MAQTSTLHQRVAVIVGASSGIGKATAVALAARGAPVALLARRADRLEAIASQIIEAGGGATAYPVDVTNPEDVSEVARRITDKLGSASIVFNNAGVMLPTPILETDISLWDRQIDLNIRGFSNVARAFAPLLKASAQQFGVADLVNTASIAARVLFPTFSVYAASKAYVSHFGDTLRAEFGPLNIRVTTLEPGIVDTELQNHIDDARVKQRLEGTRRSVEWLQPEDVAETVAFVVSQPARVNLARIALLPTRQAN